MTDNPYKESGPMTPSDEKTWAIVQYILGIFADVVAPLVAYLVFKGRGPFITHHTKQHLNFSITLMIAYLVLAISIIGWVLFWVPYLLGIAVRIYGAYKASQGEQVKLPLTYEFVK